MADQLMNPRGVFHYEKKPLAPRPKDLNKKVLGLVDNSKNNADLFLVHVQEVLSRTHTFTDTLRVEKPAGSVPANFPQEFLDRCDVVINAFGD